MADLGDTQLGLTHRATALTAFTQQVSQCLLGNDEVLVTSQPQQVGGFPAVGAQQPHQHSIFSSLPTFPQEDPGPPELILAGANLHTIRRGEKRGQVCEERRAGCQALIILRAGSSLLTGWVMDR